MAVYDKVHPETLGCVYSIGRFGILDMAVGTYVDRARSTIAERTIEPYLLFVDADMVFEPEDLGRLKEALDDDPTIGAVAALYVYRDQSLKPVVHWINDGMWESGMYVLNRTLKNMKEDAVDDVDVFGTGFILIRTEAMKSLDEPYFVVKYNEETKSYWGEDAMFAQRLKEKGWRACVHFGVQVGHIGKATFWPKELLDIQIPEDEEAIKKAGMMERQNAV